MTDYLKTTTLLIGTVLLLSALKLKAQHHPQSIFDQMNYTEVLDITIITNLQAIADKHSEVKHPATLSFVDAGGVLQQWEVKLSARGKFRRMRCTEIPPLKINFDKDELREAGLTKFDDLKLVNECLEDGEAARETLLKEYLAYQLYHEITPESFRVQFLNITYTDVHTGESIVRAGFIIEDAAQLSDRIGAKKVEQERGFRAAQFNATQFQRMALFQYWIGNSDWSAIFGRNIKVLEKDGQLIAIPYDFDFAGMVDAPYATPNSNYGLTSVQQRAYIGFETEVKAMEESIQQLVSMRAALKKVVKNQKLLSRASRREVWKYLVTYFNHPKAIAFGREVEIIPNSAEPVAEQVLSEK
jgi:hypothetical protein